MPNDDDPKDDDAKMLMRNDGVWLTVNRRKRVSEEGVVLFLTLVNEAVRDVFADYRNCEPSNPYERLRHAAKSLRSRLADDTWPPNLRPTSAGIEQFENLLKMWNKM